MTCHFDRRNKAPGKNAASTNPMQKRVKMAPAYLHMEWLRQGDVKKHKTYDVVVPEQRALSKKKNDNVQYYL